MSVSNEKERQNCYKRLNIGGRIGLLDYLRYSLCLKGVQELMLSKNTKYVGMLDSSYETQNLIQ